MPQKTKSTPAPAAVEKAPAPEAAPTATPEQATVGNAEVAANMPVPKADKSALLDEGDGDSGMSWDQMMRQTRENGMDPTYFAETASPAVRRRMLDKAPDGVAATYLGTITPGHVARLITTTMAPFSLDQQLRVMRLCPAVVPKLSVDFLIQLFASGPKDEVAAHMSAQQMRQFASSVELGTLVLTVRKCNMDLTLAAYEGLGYIDGASFIVRQEEMGTGFVGILLDATSKGEIKAALEATSNDLSLHEAYKSVLIKWQFDAAVNEFERGE